MQTRPLGKTGLQVPILSFGASSLGQEFRAVSIEEAIRSVHVALDLGMNFIDTSPYYGRGMSEVLLGVALRGIARERYLLGTKLGRYDRDKFDFRAERVVESVDVSLHRMGVDYLDICLCHDIEYVPLQRIVEETLPALRKVQQQGKVRFIGVSGYPMKIFRFILERTDLDVVLSYNQYTLQNTRLAELVPTLKERQVGIINAGPCAARLLTNAPLPAWHKEPEEVKRACQRAAKHCHAHGVDIAQLALQFSLDNSELATTVVGSANPEHIREWAAWAEAPRHPQLLKEVLGMLAPVHDIGHVEGLPENN